MGDQTLSIVLIIIFVIFLIALVCVCIWYAPCCTNPNKSKTRAARPRFIPNFLTAIRSQHGTDILPPIPILTLSTPIALNQPFLENGLLKIRRSGMYDIKYSLLIQWNAEATATLYVRKRSVETQQNFEDLIGSLIEETNVERCTRPISHSFLAQLNAGDVLLLCTKASVEDVIFIPGSNQTFNQSATTLASLSVVQIQHM